MRPRATVGRKARKGGTAIYKAEPQQRGNDREPTQFVR